MKIMVPGLAEIYEADVLEASFADGKITGLRIDDWRMEIVV